MRVRVPAVFLVFLVLGVSDESQAHAILHSRARPAAPRAGVYPLALRYREQVFQAIRAPIAPPCSINPDLPAPSHEPFPRPERCSHMTPAADLLYTFMSLQL